MARPGLEPGTPRFSVVDQELPYTAEIPASQRVLASPWCKLDVRKFRSFLGDLGTERLLGAQWLLPSLAPSRYAGDACGRGVQASGALACEARSTGRRAAAAHRSSHQRQEDRAGGTSDLSSEQASRLVLVPVIGSDDTQSSASAPSSRLLSTCNASVSARTHLTPAQDEDQASADARSALTSLPLHGPHGRHTRGTPSAREDPGSRGRSLPCGLALQPRYVDTGFTRCGPRYSRCVCRADTE